MPSKRLLSAVGLLLRPCDGAASDHILRRGTLEGGDGSAPAHLVHVHIPRAAGASVMNAAPSVLPVGTTLIGSGESAAWSAATHARLGEGGRLMTFLRFPPSLALSQFLYCKFQLRRRRRGRKSDFPSRTPGEARGPLGGLVPWASHFPSNSSFGCYDPTDVQFRFVAGSGNARSALGLSPRATVARALGFLERDFFFVGIVELFSESLCALAFATAGTLPPGCHGCDDDEEKRPRRRTHSLKKTRNISVASLDARQRAALDRITRKDAVLYLAALRGFRRRLDAVERTTGVALACPGALSRLLRAAAEGGSSYEARGH